MAVKEEHIGKLVCMCENKGLVDFWEWENPMHHGSDFTSYYTSHKGDFKHLGGMKFSCLKCGKEVSVA